MSCMSMSGVQAFGASASVGTWQAVPLFRSTRPCPVCTIQDWVALDKRQGDEGPRVPGFSPH